MITFFDIIQNNLNCEIRYNFVACKQQYSTKHRHIAFQSKIRLFCLKKKRNPVIIS